MGRWNWVCWGDGPGCIHEKGKVDVVLMDYIAKKKEVANERGGVPRQI